LVTGLGGGLMELIGFIPSVVLIYMGLTLLAIDFRGEPLVKPKKWFRTFGTVAFIAIIVWFTHSIVFIPAPLNLEGVVVAGEYPKDTTIAGIKWKPEFTQLFIIIGNPTDRAYEDLFLEIKPDKPIAAMGQLTSISDVYCEPKLLRELFPLKRVGDPNLIPLQLVATNAGYFLRCRRLPGKTDLKIVAAIVGLKTRPQPEHAPLGMSSDVWGTGTIDDKSYVLTMKAGEVLYWYGRIDSDIYTREPVVNKLQITGKYVATRRERHISQNAKLFNLFGRHL